MLGAGVGVSGKGRSLPRLFGKSSLLLSLVKKAKGDWDLEERGSRAGVICSGWL